MITSDSVHYPKQIVELIISLKVYWYDMNSIVSNNPVKANREPPSMA